MSRQLPPTPNFDYLKKQAKELLAELLPQHPDLRLADAQRRLARDYGFPSWAALKAHVLDVPGRALTGTWQVNLSRSRQSAANLFRDATLQISLHDGAVTIADVVVDQSGRRTATRTAWSWTGGPMSNSTGMRLRRDGSRRATCRRRSRKTASPGARWTIWWPRRPNDDAVDARQRHPVQADSPVFAYL